MPGKSVEVYIRTLQDTGRGCNFGQNESENFRDRLIAGMADRELSQKLQFEQNDLTLEKATDTAGHWEFVKMHKFPQRWMLLDGGDNRNNPNVTTSRRRATTRENKQSTLTTNAYIAYANTDRPEMTRALQLMQNVGNVARKDILRQCAGQNMSTKSDQFLLDARLDRLPSSTS